MLAASFGDPLEGSVGEALLSHKPIYSLVALLTRRREDGIHLKLHVRPCCPLFWTLLALPIPRATCNFVAAGRVAVEP